MNEREMRDFQAGLGEEVDSWLRGENSRREFLTKSAKLAAMSDPNAPAKPEFLALQAAGLLIGKCSGSGLERAWTMECPGTAHGEVDGGWIGSDEGHTPGLSDEAKVWENGGFQYCRK